MKYLKSTVLVVTAALCLLAVDAMAASGGGQAKTNPYATTIDSPFKGVVTVVSVTTVTVKGDAKFKNPAGGNAYNGDTRGKPPRESVHFAIGKDTKLMRDGKPCDMKVVQKGDSASVEFTTKQGSDKRYVSKIDFTSGSGASEEKK